MLALGDIEDSFIAYSRRLCGGWHSYSNAIGYIPHLTEKSASLFAHTPPFDILVPAALLLASDFEGFQMYGMQAGEIGWNSRI